MDDSLQIENVFTCPAAIDKIEWSADAAYVLCAVFKKDLVQVFAVNNPSWQCRINEGLSGLVDARWSPSSREIVTFADFQLHATVWSLVDRSSFVIKNPKHGSVGALPGAAPKSRCGFSPRGDLFAVARRHDCKDSVCVFSCAGGAWSKMHEFLVDTVDLEALQWSGSGSTIVVTDNALEYLALVYAVDGRLLSRYAAYENALGIKSAPLWSPDGKQLALGSYDGCVRLLNALTWKCMVEFEHSPRTVRKSAADFVREVLTEDDALVEAAISDQALLDTRVDESGEDRRLHRVEPDPAKPNPKVGVGALRFSPCGAYLASRCDEYPRAVWVWDCASLRLRAVLEFRSRVASFRWSDSSQLAVATGCSAVFVWTSDGEAMRKVDVPEDVGEAWGTVGIRWRPNAANGLSLMTKKRICNSELRNNNKIIIKFLHPISSDVLSSPRSEGRTHSAASLPSIEPESVRYSLPINP